MLVQYFKPRKYETYPKSNLLPKHSYFCYHFSRTIYRFYISIWEFFGIFFYRIFGSGFGLHDCLIRMSVCSDKRVLIGNTVYPRMNHSFGKATSVLHRHKTQYMGIILISDELHNNGYQGFLNPLINL